MARMLSRVAQNNSLKWPLFVKLQASDATSAAHFGAALAVGTKRTLIGSSDAISFAGEVYMYDGWEFWPLVSPLYSPRTGYYLVQVSGGRWMLLPPYCG